MRKIRHILSALVIFCLLSSLSLTAFAANTSMIINGVTISEITIEGAADGITSNSNSYQIKATDTKKVGQSAKVVTRELTFTNTYPGYIKITYTGCSNGTLAAVEKCTIEGGVITMQSGGKFTITVKSPGTTTSTLSKKSTTCTFSPTAIEKEQLTPTISFEPSSNGSYTVKDANKAAVNVGSSANSTSYTLTATPASGYKVCCWVFTEKSTGAKTSFGINTATVAYNEPTVEGTITCVFMPTDSAMYTVGGVYYAYLDEAIKATENGTKTIVVVGSGKVCHSDGKTTKFTIPSGVTLVLPYAAGQTYVNLTDLSSNDYFPYGNYPTDASTSYAAQPTSLKATNVELTIPSGTTVANNGTISVGGTLYGNATMAGNHSNLKIEKNAVLELKSSTSVLSAIGNVYGEGRVVANGSKAKIFQPLSLHRPSGWGWGLVYAGYEMGGGMITHPSEGYPSLNASPRYSTQAIQCNLEMKYGDIMYAYADQYNESHWRCTVILIGTDPSNSLIALKSGATLSSKYESGKTSSLDGYSNIGKLTLTIDGGGPNGGATQGTLMLGMSGYTLALSNWPFPVPYNYDVVLENGAYELKHDISFLPGAGLKVAEDATLTVPKDVHLAVFTGANDHSKSPNGKAVDILNGVWSVEYSDVDYTTSYNGGTTKSPYYPVNSTLAKVSTLNGVSGGSMMANFIVDGVLDVKSGAYFGGIVQTGGTGTVIMNGVTENASGKDYVFTQQLGMTGHAKEVSDWDQTKWASVGATIYKFYPQYFDSVTGELTTMTSGTTYMAANGTTNALANFSFDLYTNSADVTEKVTKTETINAKPVGQWEILGVTFDANADASEITGEMADQHVGYDTAVALNENKFERDGYVFNGWNTAADGSGTTYADKAEIKITKAITLYAQWLEDACAHTNKSKTEEPATCEKGGHKAYWTCPDCSKNFSDEACISEITDLDAWLKDETENGGLISALGHDYEGVETVYTWNEDYTSCTASRTCKRCGTEGGEPTETVSAVQITEEVTKAATCVEIGTKTYTATFEAAEEGAWVPEDAKDEVEIPIDTENGHNTDGVVAHKDATCAETGVVGGTYCTHCGEGKAAAEAVITATGHTYTSAETKAPTCTEAGYTTYTCACGDSYVADEVAATGHTWRDATFDAPKTCSVCGATEGEKKVAVAQIGETKYEDAATALRVAKYGETVTLLADVELAKGDIVVMAEGAVLDLNKHSIKGTVLGTYDMNGGLLITNDEDSYKMIGDGATYYQTTDAVVKIGATDITIVSGTVTLADNWWTLEGQSLVIGEEATFIIPDGLTLQILSPVVVHGKVTVVGTANLYVAEATIQAPAGIENITTTVAGSVVWHDETKYVVHKHTAGAEADCENAQICTVCEAVLEEAKGHTLTQVEAKEATCTEAGYEAYEFCSACDYTTYAEVAATGHNYDAVVTAPTCTEAGYTTYSCACGDTYVADEVAATGHNWAEATFEAPKTCSVCGATEGEKKVAVAQIGTDRYETLAEALAVGGEVVLLANIETDSAFVVNNEVELNLNGFGVKTTEKDTNGDGVFHVVAGGDLTINGEGVINGVGGNDYNIAIWADGGKVTINGGTYTNVGAGDDDHYDVIYAKNGGQVIINGGKFIAQTPEWTLNSYDTHYEAGVTFVVNGGEFHGFNPYNNAAEGAGTNFCAAGLHASADENGVYTIHKCKTETLVAVAPTCTATGLTEGKKCEACGETLVAQEVIPANGHKYDAAVTEPTCTDKGYTTYTCACGDSYVADEVAATGHDYDAVVTVPTCTEQGYTTYTCACGDTYTEEIAAKGHALVAVEAKAPTCTEAGYEAYEYCTACDYTTFEEVAATGHDYDAVVTAPTCTEAGYTTYTCACGDTYVADEVAATGHSYTAAETTAPTCTVAGVMTYTCVCGDTYTEEIAATGHKNTTEHDRVDPTYDEVGYTAGTYCEDCSTWIEGHEEIPMLTGVEVNIDVRTNKLAEGPQVTLLSGTNAGEGWDKEGTVIAGETVDFSVTFDKACVVIAAIPGTDGSVTYTKVPAIATEDENTYNFSVNVVSGLEIFVAVKGDANKDGRITAADANMAKAHYLKNSTPITALEEVICDVNNRGGITAADANMIKAYYLKNEVPINW